MDLDKKTAALIQIETAIGCFRNGNYIATITLCGAAESCLPKTQNASWFDETKELLSSIAPQHFKVKDWIFVMNLERDWLKHHNTEQQNIISIDKTSSNVWITRALTKFVSVFGEGDLSMIANEEWDRRPHTYAEMFEVWNKFLRN